MTRKHLSYFVFALVGTVLAPAFAQAGDSADAALSYYMGNIADKDAGVYDADGRVFVQISVPLPDKRKRNRIRGEVLKSGTVLLKKWVVSISGGKAGKVEDLDGNAERLADLFDEFVPGWGLPEWDFKACMREVPHTEKDGFYRTAWIFEKKELMDRMPESYRQAIDASTFRKMAPGILAKIFEGTRRDEFIGKVLDASAVGKIDGKIADYLEEAKRANEYRAILGESRNPTPVESWTERPGEPSKDSVTEVVVVTNPIVNVAVSTNRLERLLNAEEIAAGGRRYKNKATETDISSDVEVVETRKITTVTETTRVIRRRHSVATRGYARFEELFLSGGKATNFASPSTEFGMKALSSGAEVELVEALRENPGDRAAWLKLGGKLAESGELEGAWICARAAEAIEPGGDGLHALQMALSSKMKLSKLEFAYAVISLGMRDGGEARENAMKVLSL